MTSIHFRYRKTEQEIDSHYYIGEAVMQKWLVGDSVSVCFPLEAARCEEMRKAVDNLLYDKRMHVGGGLAHVPCRVIERHHAAVWEKAGHLGELSDSILLEAVSGEAEDLLLWIMLERRPAWAED